MMFSFCLLEIGWIFRIKTLVGFLGPFYEKRFCALHWAKLSIGARQTGLNQANECVHAKKETRKTAQKTHNS